MNCTRTGGWVTRAAECSSPGGRSVAPLILDSGISWKVSRPYAKKPRSTTSARTWAAATRATGSAPRATTATAGPRTSAATDRQHVLRCLGSHLFFQAEKPDGGHYVNLMNSAYNRCGIGVWVASGRVRLVIDFYHS